MTAERGGVFDIQGIIVGSLPKMRSEFDLWSCGVVNYYMHGR